MYIVKYQNGAQQCVQDKELPGIIYAIGVVTGTTPIDTVLHIDEDEFHRETVETAKLQTADHPMQSEECNALTELTVYLNRIAKLLPEHFGEFSYLIVDGTGHKRMHLITDRYPDDATVKDSDVAGYFTAEFKCNDCDVEIFGRKPDDTTD